MPNDPFILQQPIDIALGELRHLLNLEPRKRFAEVLPLAEDCQPAQTSLKTLQADLLKEAGVIVDRKAPFFIVVLDVKRIANAPEAARDARIIRDEPI